MAMTIAYVLSLCLVKPALCKNLHNALSVISRPSWDQIQDEELCWFSQLFACFLSRVGSFLYLATYSQILQTVDWSMHRFVATCLMGSRRANVCQTILQRRSSL